MGAGFNFLNRMAVEVRREVMFGKDMTEMRNLTMWIYEERLFEVGRAGDVEALMHRWQT